MGFKCGIVGLPNVGKSTLFKALTRTEVNAQNYPFCTIDPNIGVVLVPDPRLDQLGEIVHPERTLSTAMQFVDIAGLVRGASQGEGLGNQFLAHIRETDAIAHVVRCFEDKKVIHVDNEINPVQDIETIQTELFLADLESVERALLKLSKLSKTQAKGPLTELELQTLQRLREHLNQGQMAKQFTMPKELASTLRTLHLMTDKPMMIIANVSEQGFADNRLLAEVQAFGATHQINVIPACASFEADLIEFNPEESREWFQTAGIENSSLETVIREGYALLGLQTYFTAGVKEVRAWTIPQGATAPQAAAAIHSDFEKGFIRAEVIHFEDFVRYKGEAGAKEAGKWRLEGKEYIVQEGDVMHFRFNV